MMPLTNDLENAHFDNRSYQEVNRGRDAVIHKVVPKLRGTFNLKTAIDVACGVGYYTKYLLSNGFEVTATDVREENAKVARLRCPEANVMTLDAEMQTHGQCGTYDLVFCAGLLYHLENPMSTIRGLRSMCTKVCLLETRVHWAPEPIMQFVRDGDDVTQATRQYAFLPSRRCMIEMMYAVGFGSVYTIPFTSRQTELSHSLFRPPRRDFFVGTIEPSNLTSAGLLPHQRLDEQSMRQDAFYFRSVRGFVRSIASAFHWL